MWRLCSGFTLAAIYDLQIPASSLSFFLFFVLCVFRIWGMNTFCFAERLHLSQWSSLRPSTLLSSVDQSFASQPEIVHLSLCLSLFPVLPITPPLPLSFVPQLGSICAALSPDMPMGEHKPRKTWKMDHVWALHHNGEPSQGRFFLSLNLRSCTDMHARMHTYLRLLTEL